MKKKLKEKAFAPGVNREEVYGAEATLGLSLDEFVAVAITGLQQITGYEGRIQPEVSTMAAPAQQGTYWFRSAEAADAARVAQLVDAAYRHYVERIGMLPGPMTDDHAEVIRNRQVTVAEHHGAIVGIIVLTVTDEGFLVDNVAVHPGHRGTGLGRALLQFAEAEARRAGFDSLYLYTHEQMTENLALYARIGYVEYDRRSQGAFSLVYLRKQLG